MQLSSRERERIAHSPENQILDDLRRIVQVLRESSRAAEQQLGVTGAQLFVLRTLANDGTLALRDLAERTHTHQSTVSVVVTRLVEQGLVRSVRATDDARRLAVTLTARGHALLARAPAAAQDRLVEGLALLADAHRRQLAVALGRLTKAMALDDTPPTMFFEEASTAKSPPKSRARRARS